MGSGLKHLVALALSVLVLGSATGARADDDDKAACKKRLLELEAALDGDAKYARDWQAAWLVTGSGLITLNLAKAFQTTDYRRGESLVYAVTSSLLMLQVVPTATTTGRALQGLRTAQNDDPCLALPSTRYMLETNADDGDLHRGVIPHVIGIAFNLLTGAVLALATGHWDFAGHGSEGISTLMGIAVGELQVLTYPRGSLRTNGTSLAVSF